jgi:hypothetical protein
MTQEHPRFDEEGFEADQAALDPDLLDDPAALEGLDDDLEEDDLDDDDDLVRNLGDYADEDYDPDDPGLRRFKGG